MVDENNAETPQSIDTGNASDFYGATFLKAELVRQAGLEGTQMIDKVIPEIIKVEDKPEQKKLGLYFQGFKEFELILNKTNAKILSEAYGNNYHDWSGKPVEVKIKEIEVSGKTMDAIRLEVKKKE